MGGRLAATRTPSGPPGSLPCAWVLGDRSGDMALSWSTAAGPARRSRRGWAGVHGHGNGDVRPAGVVLDRLDHFFADVDVNHDGMISFDEWL